MPCYFRYTKIKLQEMEILFYTSKSTRPVEVNETPSSIKKIEASLLNTS